MPKIRHIPTSSEYADVSIAAAEAKEKRDCMPKALTLLTGLPYDVVNDALIKAGRKPRKGTHWHVVHEAMSMLGYKLEPLGSAYIRSIIDQYPGGHKTLHNITTRHPQRFPKAWADREPLLFDVGRHVAAFKDGVLHDWSCNRALRVDQLYRVVKVDEPLLVSEVKEKLGEKAIPMAPEQVPTYAQPFAMGEYDFHRGHTACPYGDADHARKWRSGYQQAKDKYNGQ